jgi:hypothetical protein
MLRRKKAICKTKTEYFRNADCALFGTEIFELKIHLADVQSCFVRVCVMKKLSFVVFSLVSDVHKFDFRLFRNVTPKKATSVEGKPCSDTESCL